MQLLFVVGYLKIICLDECIIMTSDIKRKVFLNLENPCVKENIGKEQSAYLEIEMAEIDLKVKENEGKTGIGPKAEADIETPENLCRETPEQQLIKIAYRNSDIINFNYYQECKENSNNRNSLEIQNTEPGNQILECIICFVLALCLLLILLVQII